MSIAFQVDLHMMCDKHIHSVSVSYIDLENVCNIVVSTFSVEWWNAFSRGYMWPARDRKEPLGSWADVWTLFCSFIKICKLRSLRGILTTLCGKKMVFLEVGLWWTGASSGQILQCRWKVGNLEKGETPWHSMTQKLKEPCHSIVSSVSSELVRARGIIFHRKAELATKYQETRHL
jgi:hypothetical protein